MPAAMDEVLSRRPVIAAAAARFAPSRRYWAVVGNGPNTVAANEVRIKLSELCYKSISCDVTEDKKHIDLSCEPMILVCAAGLGEGTSTDVAKEVAIYKAHKAVPIVIATEGSAQFEAAAAVLHVPQVDSTLGFVLSAMVGHLFGYDAALAIDALAVPLRRVREVVEHVVERGGNGGEALLAVERRIGPAAQEFLAGLRTGQYDGNLEASTAVRVVSLLRTVTSPEPLRDYQRETGRVATPGVLLDDLVTALTRAVDELTRPVDAIKHQAKTVTVGISRADEALLAAPLVRAVLSAGAARDHLGYRDLRALAALDAAVLEVTGSTRYRIAGDPESGEARIAVLEQRGIAATLPSRTSANPVLKGTKHLVAVERLCFVARGRSDGRTVILVPEVEHGRTTGLTLVHVRFADHLDPRTMRGVLSAYRNRLAALTDAVTETEPSFDEAMLGRMGVADLLTEPVNVLADRWRAMARG